ncbi:MAG: ComF family protein [Microcystaceae cyanobacterium]
MKNFNDLPDTFFLGSYHPKYNYYDDYYEDNWWFNEFSNNILDLKDRNSLAIYFFLNRLKHLISDDEVIVTTVPSHSCNISSSGIRDLAQKLVQSKKDFIDGTLCLERFKSIEKLSSSFNNRSLNTHLNSVKISHSELIKDKQVILMDDVLTSGNSVQACKQLLLEGGAKAVKIIVLGKTIRNPEELHYCIEQKRDELIECEQIDTYYYKFNELEYQYEFYISMLDEQVKYGEIDDEEYYDLRQNIDYEDYQHKLFLENCLGHTEDWYKECAMEAHNAIEGTDYFRPNNPFISILLEE